MKARRPKKKKEGLIRVYAKWPRQYAAEIIAEHDIEKRRKMLKAIPDGFRELTEMHVLIYHEWKEFRKKQELNSKPYNF